MNTRLFTLLSGLLLIAAASASAQSRDPYFTTLGANYDVIYHDADVTSHTGAHFDVASTFKRDIPFMGPVAEVGFNHFEGATIFSLLGGVRLRIPGDDRRVLPFAQVLAGLDRCGVCDSNDFALQGGGGLDFRLSDRDFRLRTQLDVRHVFDASAGFNTVRFSIGVVVPLNR